MTGSLNTESMRQGVRGAKYRAIRRPDWSNVGRGNWRPAEDRAHARGRKPGGVSRHRRGIMGWEG